MTPPLEGAQAEVVCLLTIINYLEEGGFMVEALEDDVDGGVFAFAVDFALFEMSEVGGFDVAFKFILNSCQLVLLILIFKFLSLLD